MNCLNINHTLKNLLYTFHKLVFIVCEKGSIFYDGSLVIETV